MKINKRSFSRALQEKVLGKDIPYPKSLCTHFWLTVFVFSCVTIFAPITFSVFLVHKIINVCTNILIRRTSRFHIAGRDLTIEQAYRIAKRLGFVRSEYNDFAILCAKFVFNLSFVSNRKNRSLLYGWCMEHGKSGIHTLWKYSNDLIKSKKRPTVNNTSRIAGIIFSYIPTLYWSIATAGAMFIAVMLPAWIWSYGNSLLWGILIGMLFVAMWILVFYLLYFGSENGGMINGLVTKYGRPLQDDVFIAYLKATRKKICPLIEWVD